VLPASQHGLGELDHHPGIPRDPLAVERRLCETSLAQPELAFAGKESVAEQRAQHVVVPALDEAAILSGEHVFQVPRMIQQDHQVGTKA